MYDLKELQTSAKSRRSFLKRMTAAGLGVAAVALIDGKFSKSDIALGDTTLPNLPNDFAAFPGIPGSTINEVVLNFALTLEILEADLYRQALNRATLQTLPTPLAGNPSSYTLAVSVGAIPTPMVDAAFAYLVQFAYVEAAHRDFLITAINGIGGTPVSANTNGYRFPVSIPRSLSGILALLLPLEETGVRAYLGALPYVTSLDLAQAAATIFSTEARHSAIINNDLGLDAGPYGISGNKQVTDNYPAGNTFEYYYEPAQVINLVQAYFG